MYITFLSIIFYFCHPRVIDNISLRINDPPPPLYLFLEEKHMPHHSNEPVTLSPNKKILSSYLIISLYF